MTAAAKLDAKDRLILDLLQEDAMMPIADIATRVGLTNTPCWRRIQKLEHAGFIKRRLSVLDRRLMNVSTTVFVTVKAARHSSQWLDTFREIVGETAEIVEAYRLSGEQDYIFKVVVPDIAHYDQLYQQLIERLEFADVSSSFAMEELKYTTSLPTRYAQ